MYNIENYSDLELRNLPVSDPFVELAKKILSEFMNFRRVPKSYDLCSGADCMDCSSIHLPKIISAVKRNEPVIFVLPAFPGKSPNNRKVLGSLPDHAERLSLKFLEELCNRVKKFYVSGVKIIICSDGRVFSDVVGIKEADITAYQIELDRIIEENSYRNISTFNLDDFYKNISFEEMRTILMEHYGSSLETLKQRILNGAKPSASLDEQEANRMYKGMTRFLFEDSMYPGQEKSRTAVQKEARIKAYEVIRRSNAWSKLIEELFPEAVRLSIHPQTCGSKKLGIRLINKEAWITPWHGVAVKTSEGYELLKRAEAEDLGAELIYSLKGRPDYYVIKH